MAHRSKVGAILVGLTLSLLSALGARAEPHRDPPRASIPPSLLAALPRDEANHALLPATQAEDLPEGYMPPDLVPLGRYGLPQRGGQQLRELVIPDLWTMVHAAQEERVQLWVLSSYRSYPTQASTYYGYVQRWGVQVADQRSARPGHSQHQLGTAIDFNELNPAFVAGPAGRWLWQHAHEYGFVFPYTPASVGRTGYVFEPWHVRWVGRDLAQYMWEAGYQESSELTADDYVAAARAAVRASLESRIKNSSERAHHNGAVVFHEAAVGRFMLHYELEYPD